MDAHHQRLGSDTEVMISHLADTFALLIGDTKTHLVSHVDRIGVSELIVRMLSTSRSQKRLQKLRYSRL